jgi:integrase
MTHGLTVAQAVAKFLAAKKASGVKVKANYERTLPGFCEAVGEQAIATVTPEAIQAWLAKFTHPVTQNSHRRRVVTLFRWCRKKGMLPLDVMTTAERTDSAQEGNEVIGLVTPEQLRASFRLIQKKAPELIPALTLLSMCGMRRAEVDRQDWKHIDLERKILRVSHAKPNTPAHRLIGLPDCALEWLLEHRAKAGAVSPKNATDRIRRLCSEGKITLAANGFRHMWISARVAVSGDINGTSLEAGNTPHVLIKHYRELVRLEEARAWFDIHTGKKKTAEVVPLEVRHA